MIEKNHSMSQTTKSSQSSKLPPFVMNFLIKNKIKIIPRSNKSQNLKISSKGGKIEKAVDSILQCRSPRAIQKAYDCLRKIVFNSPPFLQTEIVQLLFPYFFTLGYHLCKLNYIDEFDKFFDKYKGDFSKQQQEEIHYSLCDNFGSDIEPHFEVNISQFAVYDLTQKFRQYDSVLLPYVFENWISVKIVPFRTNNFLQHDLDQEMLQNPIDDLQTEINDGTLQSYSKIDLNPDICKSDQSYISTSITEGEFFGQENQLTEVPNIAHFTIYNHHNELTDIKLSKSSELLAYSQNSQVRLHLLNPRMFFPNRTNQSVVLRHKNKVMTIAFSDSSSLIASGSIDGSIRVAHTEVCHEICHFDYHVKPVYDLSFDQNGFFITAASHDRTVSMWAMNNVGMIRQFIGHKQPVVKTLFISNRPQLSMISAAADAKIRVWDVGSAKMVEQFDMKSDTPTALAIHPEKNFIASGGINGVVYLFDVDSHRDAPTELFTKDLEKSGRVADIKFTNDGKWLVAGYSTGRIAAWSLDGTIYDECEACASTIDSICISNRNLIMSAGRSLRGAGIGDKSFGQSLTQMPSQS